LTMDIRDIDQLQAGMVAVLGVPFDAFSSYLRGSAKAPDIIRAALNSPSSNLSSENGVDYEHEPRVIDLGNISFESEKDYAKIRDKSLDILKRGAKLFALALGGDHSITYPLVQAFHQVVGKINILHLDAHSDTYAEFEGNPFSHACPFARIMEEGLAKRLVQVGIRTLTAHQREQIKRFQIEVVEMKDWRENMEFLFDGPLYLSVDLDVLDPAFVPGVSHHEPGGLTTRQVISLIQRLHNPIIGADLVELNPERDSMGMTAMVAAKLFKEIGARMLEEPEFGIRA
jgi:arginase